MRTQRLFRYVWRINAVLILLVAGTMCLLGASMMLSEFGCNLQRRRAVEAAPTVVADAKERFYLGPMREVEGADVIRGQLLAPSQDLGITSGKGSDTRNILYVDPRSTEAHWLLPDSARVISEEETVWHDAKDSKERRQIAGLALVKPVTPNQEVAEGTLLIFDPAGRRVTTVAEGVRALNHAGMQDDDIFVLYERGRRYVRAIIDARSLEVRTVEEITVPEIR